MRRRPRRASDTQSGRPVSLFGPRAKGNDGRTTHVRMIANGLREKQLTCLKSRGVLRTGKPESATSGRGFLESAWLCDLCEDAFHHMCLFDAGELRVEAAE